MRGRVAERCPRSGVLEPFRVYGRVVREAARTLLGTTAQGGCGFAEEVLRKKRF
jgi:hypothetical protein